MERWQNKVAVVTGASSGIGASIFKELVRNGMVVVGLARRREKMLELRNEVPENLKKNMHALHCDLTSEQSITEAFDHIEKNIGFVDALVYSAGILKHGNAMDNSLDDLKRVMSTNFMGSVLCTTRVYKSMMARKFDGHLININSSLGSHIPVVEGLNLYPASKHALNAFTQVMRNEMARQKITIKTTSINPGMVYTELPGELGEKLYTLFPYMYVDDVAKAVVYALSTPPHMNITNIDLKPVGEECLDKKNPDVYVG